MKAERAAPRNGPLTPAVWHITDPADPERAPDHADRSLSRYGDSRQTPGHRQGASFHIPLREFLPSGTVSVHTLGTVTAVFSHSTGAVRWNCVHHPGTTMCSCYSSIQMQHSNLDWIGSAVPIYKYNAELRYSSIYIDAKQHYSYRSIQTQHSAAATAVCRYSTPYQLYVCRHEKLDTVKAVPRYSTSNQLRQYPYTALCTDARCNCTVCMDTR